MAETNTATEISPSKMSNISMEAYRNAAFRKMVVQRLHEGKVSNQSPQQVVNEIAREQRAIANAITSPEFVNAAADALIQAQNTLIPNARYHTLPEQAHETMFQIMRRRAAEAHGFATQVTNPNFYGSLSAELPTNAPVRPSLHDVKINDVLHDLLNLDAKGEPQVIAHIDAAAKGMVLEHDALAITFDPSGPLHKPLMDLLSARLPDAKSEYIHQLTLDWLSQRESAAKLTSDLASNNGEAYRMAVLRSSQWHRNKHETPLPAPSQDEHSPGIESSVLTTEHEKTALQRAEDVSYTLNHAISCGTTDVILQPAIAALFGINVGCGGDHGHDHNHHEHDHDHHHAHNHAKPKLTLKSFAHEAGHYFKGEIIGDLAAVPLTIAVQRTFPGFMNGLRKLLEPIFGWAFRLGANHSAREKAKLAGVNPNASEVREHANQIYEHEMSHLPQAAVWNMFAFPIGAIGQKLGGHARSYSEILKSKAVGALISNGILIGGRMIAPQTAQKWDQTMGETVIAPASKTIGKLFGVDEDAMEKARKNRKDNEKAPWEKRVTKETAAPIEASNVRG